MLIEDVGTFLCESANSVKLPLTEVANVLQ
jgi:hypothetical protein